MIEMPSPNYDARTAGVPIDILLLHYTGMQTAQEALERLCERQAKVSAHYLIDEAGETFMLVPEDHRAWHAGVAQWRGNTDINARSIGIELVNPGHEFGYRSFTEPQMQAAEKLALKILERHPIPARNVIGHSDVAPSRKNDPGELFDWQGLAERSIGVWPTESDMLDMSKEAVASDLALYGYNVENLTTAIKAFQRHFRPSRVNGRIDGETARLVRGLVEGIG